MSRVALVTGITGQDGSYLAELLLEKGWIVHGIMRRASVFTTERIDHIFGQLKMHHGDMTDIAGLVHVMQLIKNTYEDLSSFYVFNLAAQTHVGVSFETPLYTAQVDALGALNLLEAIRSTGLEKIARIYQASTSELYGLVQETPQSETTPFYPRSPYGVAKLYAFWIMKNYRESYNMHISNGILFNHESQRRGKTFVTRKITIGAANIVRRLERNESVKPLQLGNLNAKRDWGHAKDFVEGMFKILEQPEPDDYVLATGETHSVKEFVEKTFAFSSIAIQWEGEGLDEKGYYNDSNGQKHILVESNSQYYRPAEVDLLLGDPSKAAQKLGWTPSTKFEDLVYEMTVADYNALK